MLWAVDLAFSRGANSAERGGEVGMLRLHREDCYALLPISLSMTNLEGGIAERGRVTAMARDKTKRVPRWCKVHSSRPVARLLTLARPAFAASLAGRNARS